MRPKLHEMDKNELYMGKEIINQGISFSDWSASWFVLGNLFIVGPFMYCFLIFCR